MAEFGESHSLPSDLWPEILPNLPVKSLLRFRSVSKSWRSLIDNPAFARSHLTHSNTNRPQSHLLLVQGRAHKKHCIVKCSKTMSTTQRLGSLQTRAMSIDTFGGLSALRSVRDWEVVCFIDGVLLLKDSNLGPITELILWNPSIRKARCLPTLPRIPDGMRNFDLGLGFDPLIKDYKHVRFVGTGWSGLHSIEVYTLGSDSWKTIQFRGKGASNWDWTIFSTGTVNFRGGLYFIGSNMNSGLSELVSFDLSVEEFDSTDLPVDDDLDSCGCDYHEALTLVDGGCLLAMGCFSNARGSLWVLKNVGGDDVEAMSWTKRYTFDSVIPHVRTCGGRCDAFLYLTENCEMLMNWTRAVTSYNLETREEKIVLKKDSSLDVFSVCGYIESLILMQVN